MTPGLSKPIEDSIRSADVSGRALRVYRYLRDNGPSHREKIIHWCGFPCPSVQPVIAYAEFANEVLRLGRILRRYGMSIEGGIATREIYRLNAGGSDAHHGS